MSTSACNEHNLVFPTREKLDLHMNSVHYYPVGTRVAADGYDSHGTVLGHNEQLGIKVEFDSGQHPEFFWSFDLRKLKDQTPGRHTLTNAEVDGGDASMFLPSGEMTAMSHEFEGFCFCGTTHRPDPANDVYITRIKREISFIENADWSAIEFERGRISGLRTALSILGVEL